MGGRMKSEKNLKFVKGKNGSRGYYVTEITLNYQRIRRFAGYTKDEAKVYLGKLRVASKEGRLEEFLNPAKPSADTFGAYARSLLDSAEWKEKRSASRNETSLKSLNRKFKNIPLSKIKPNMVRDYMTSRIKDDEVRPATVNRERSLLVSILYAAVADGLIESNTIGQKGVKRLEENNSREQRILELGLTRDDMKRLIDCADTQIRPVIEIALLTGMRFSEIVSLKWTQIDFRNLKLTIPVTNSKSKKERTIPLSRDLFETLHSIKRQGEYLFPNGSTGTHIKSIRKSFITACDKAKIPHGRDEGIVFHDLRHVAASQLVKMIDVVTASRILGHSSVEMTMRYVHPTNEDKRIALEALGNWLQGRQQDVNAIPGGSDMRLEDQPKEIVLIS